MRYFLNLSVIVVSLFFVGCNINETPKFDDNDAFVAFTSSDLSVNENQEVLKVPIMLTSLSGIESTVYYTITSGTAVEGEHFSVDGDGILSFNENNTTDTIYVNVVDNDVLAGDVSFTINISDAGSVDLGTYSSCSVTIVDDEHPLSLILGSFTASAYSYYNDDEQWTINITKDADDETKVWLYPLVSGGSSIGVYGVVNDEKTLMRIPVGQVIATSTSYPAILLKGFYGPDGATEIPTGGYISVDIAEDGSMTFQDEFGSAVYSDASATTFIGYYNIYASGCVLTKINE